eukprot:jgi/Mesvir1/28225/Mv04774-RA.1
MTESTKAPRSSCFLWLVDTTTRAVGVLDRKVLDTLPLNRSRRRAFYFLVAVLVAVLIWEVFGVIVISVLDLIKPRHRDAASSNSYSPVFPATKEATRPTSSQLTPKGVGLMTYVLPKDRGNAPPGGKRGKGKDVIWMARRDPKLPNPRCFFEIQVQGQSIGKILFELFWDKVPFTAENFRALCTGEKGRVEDLEGERAGAQDAKPKRGRLGSPALHYKGTHFHRLVSDFVVQGGDVTGFDGSGGWSIWGPQFVDENFKLKHSHAGLLSMASGKRDTNKSQFSIMLTPASYLDNQHVVFGRVIAGWDVVLKINELGTPSGIPLARVSVSDCGEVFPGDPLFGGAGMGPGPPDGYIAGEEEVVVTKRDSTGIEGLNDVDDVDEDLDEEFFQAVSGGDDAGIADGAEEF